MVKKESFGKTPQGEELTLFTLSNDKSFEVKVTDLGAIIVSVLVQDKNEVMQDVVLGYDDAQGYYDGTYFFGALIGRNGNRIGKAKFTLNGKEYQLPVNDNENNLHSNPNGFDKRKFDAEITGESSVTMSLKDADMEQGFPGNFSMSVTYTVTDENALRIEYKAACDQDTVCNMTNHTYFNLSGHDSGSIEDTELYLSAKEFTPVIDHQAIPTGEYRAVKGTVFDFTTPKTIGRDIGADDEQLKFVGGYDHNWVIARDKGTTVRFAEAYSPKAGICLEAYTDLPGFQFYSGNFIDEGVKGKSGAVYGKRHGFCLETQYYPNAINQEGFAKPVLKAGETFESVTAYKFSVR